MLKNCFSRKVPAVLDIQISSSIITCSPEHPFWVMGKGWVEAGHLLPGFPLILEDGSKILINDMQSRQGIFTVYNIEVEGFHTYYVSELAVGHLEK